MTDTEIQPDEVWRRELVERIGDESEMYARLDMFGDVQLDGTIYRSGGIGKHIAALALYGQSFGFTRDDVKLLNDLAGETDYGDRGDAAMNLAARIEALLPPHA